ncbi:hypothetical protein NAL32_07405 [Chryseobacterium sp. Ch-15]|uniref:Uncharacterized protein n=1 Tax=Chryseobacterium muglaense TaxID=2893752 RepID=A0A9Q3YPE2_9FLAO|nr:hypothetical protein [Chryseobacterium muglaense]MBD3904457.1 hypothetical protein [Chryseobacterium muglaense]MCC9032724.1 hypothetical protein [Chryseobacterium muglaense]MCM2554219.1 hypothetical protein [Chryseobacterium muglaense]
MKKYRFTITALIPLSQGKNQDVFKVEFFANDIEQAEKFKTELEELYFKTNEAFRPGSPFPRQDDLLEITDEPQPYTLGESEW